VSNRNTSHRSVRVSALVAFEHDGINVACSRADERRPDLDQAGPFGAAGECLAAWLTHSGIVHPRTRAPVDFSPDGFLKMTAVYVTEDPIWAVAYVIRSAACRRFLNACCCPAAAAEWRQRRTFLS